MGSCSKASRRDPSTSAGKAALRQRVNANRYSFTSRSLSPPASRPPHTARGLLGKARAVAQPGLGPGSAARAAIGQQPPQPPGGKCWTHPAPRSPNPTHLQRSGVTQPGRQGRALLSSAGAVAACPVPSVPPCWDAQGSGSPQPPQPGCSAWDTALRANPPRHAGKPGGIFLSSVAAG